MRALSTNDGNWVSSSAPWRPLRLGGSNPSNARVLGRWPSALVEIERVHDAAVAHHEQPAVAGDRRRRRDPAARIEVLQGLTGLAIRDEQAVLGERVDE